MKGIYLYPITARLKADVQNPYMQDLVKSLSNYYTIENKNKPSNFGIFNIIKFLPKISIVYLNWVENIPEKKGGKVQMFFFFLIIRVLKLLKIKVVWTMHNKISHNTFKLNSKKKIFLFLLRKSDLIITHSSEGVLYGQGLFEDCNIVYIPHPIKPPVQPLTKTVKKNEILLWGAIQPYKGIDKFLQYLKENNLTNKYTIKIVGKCQNEEYLLRLNSIIEDSNVSIENRFINDEELSELIAKSKIVLFTYNTVSVLSSGALIYSLSHYANVIGPDSAEFRDLKKEKIVHTYTNFVDLISKIDFMLKNNISVPKNLIDAYIMDNSWAKYSIKIRQNLLGL